MLPFISLFDFISVVDDEPELATTADAAAVNLNGANGLANCIITFFISDKLAFTDSKRSLPRDPTD